MDIITFLFAATSMISWGVGAFLSKLAANRIGERAVFWETIMYAPSVILFSVFWFRAKELIVTDKVGILLAGLAGIIGSAGIVAFYMVLTRKEASVAVPLTALYPALTALLAFIFLNESLTPVKIAGILLATLAIMLLSLS